jgi:hypothetical protein
MKLHVETGSIEYRASRAKQILRTGDKLSLEQAVRAFMSVKWAEVKQDGSVQVLDGGYRMLTDLELVNFVEQLDQGAEGKGSTMGAVSHDAVKRDHLPPQGQGGTMGDALRKELERDMPV